MLSGRSLKCATARKLIHSSEHNARAGTELNFFVIPKTAAQKFQLKSKFHFIFVDVDSETSWDGFKAASLIGA